MSTTETTEARATVSAQVPVALRAELERRAAAADRTLSAQVRRLLQAQLDLEDDDGKEAA